MKIFDDIIRETSELLDGLQFRSYPYVSGKAAEKGRKNELILQRDAAYELGAGTFASVSFTALTDKQELVGEDQILLYGNDLAQLNADSSFARITFLRTDNIEQNGEQGIYAVIKNIELKKYGISPKGYMLRASALSNREQVRVSKAAWENGLTFEQVGNLCINTYKEDPHVLAVKILFITLPKVPYPALDRLADDTVRITKALNHVLADLKMDCRACEWKPVCDQVDGMKEMHQQLVRQQ
ncbi:MAG: hypothetical protein RR297_07325 [Clostridia bacterium]